MTEKDFPDALPPGHRLHWYVLERVLGQGGFGITYLAHDSNLDRRVAIKEYLPAEVARRRSDASARPRTESHSERYAWGLERFLAEARTLARFDHPNIVRVLSIFEANNTAYMVMRFEEGEDLGTRLERMGMLPEGELTTCLMPILDGLQLIHTSGFIHRDIKPENIYVREDGTPVLLDFGSARQSFGSAKTMTILVAPGYAPLEQYYGDAKTQGPWTDIYGLGATCYRAVTGRAPLDAIARAKGVLGSTRDLLEPATSVAQGRYGDRLLRAIDHALQLSERDRPQSIAEWRREIAGQPMSVVVGAPAMAPMTAGNASPMRAAAEAQPGAASVGHEPVAPVRSPHRAAAAWALGAGGLALLAMWLVVGRPPSAASSAATTTARAANLVAVQPAPRMPLPPASASNIPIVEPPKAVVPAAVVKTRMPAVVLATVEPAKREPIAKLAKNDEAGSVRPASPSASRVLPVVETAAPPANATTSTGTTTTASPALPVAPLATSTTLAVAAPAPLPTPSPAARRRDEQLDAAEAALRTGDAARAAQLAEPWADAGVARAQTLFGRVQEARAKEQRNDFQAYLWYSMAARRGEPTAQALKDKVAGRMQPAEIRQAEKLIDVWKPQPEPATSP